MAFDPLGTLATQSLTSTARKSVLLKLKRPSGLMSSPEWMAFELLQKAPSILNKGYLLFPQVHLMQVVQLDVAGLVVELARRNVWPQYIKTVEAQITKQWQFAVGWRSLDFLVCDGRGNVAGAIEIDDERHGNVLSVDVSDTIKNIVFASIGKPLLRITNDEVFALVALPEPDRPAGTDAQLAVSRNLWNSFTASLK